MVPSAICPKDECVFLQISQEIMLLSMNNMHEKSNTMPNKVIQCKLLYYLCSSL